MTEQELIEGCIKKNLICQQKLFEQYAGKMMTICLRYASDKKEAEDILQESFIRIFSHIHQYKSEGSFDGWIKRVVVNCALRVLQNKKISFVEINDTIDQQHLVNTTALANIETKELIKLIGSLPDGYRTVFNLYVMEGYDHNEIANMLNINPATSRSQLLKARKMLKTKIEMLQKLPNGYVG